MIHIVHVQSPLYKGIRYAVVSDMIPELLKVELEQKLTHEFGKQIDIVFESSCHLNELSIEKMGVHRILYVE